MGHGGHFQVFLGNVCLLHLALNLTAMALQTMKRDIGIFW